MSAEYPPFPDPDTLIADARTLANITGLEELMPGMGAFMAAMSYVTFDAIAGECKDCPCIVCVRIRNVGQSVIRGMSLWSQP